MEPTPPGVPLARSCWEVFSVGRLDGRRGPFGGAHHFPPERTVTVDLADEDWPSRWPWSQPGPLDAEGGFLPATVEVVFEAAPPPPEARFLRLRLSVLSGRGPCPQLDVALNGVVGRLYLSPVRLDRSDILGAQTMIGAWAKREVFIPLAALHVGENHLAFTTRQEEAEDDPPPAVARAAPFWGGFGSTLVWGGAVLDAVGGPAPETELTVSPTPLFVDGPDGPAELVDVVLTEPLGFSAGRIELGVRGDEQEERSVGALSRTARQFGQWRWRLAVPEAATAGADRAYRCRLELDGRVLESSGTYRTARHWTVHLMPHVHLDLGYTDRQGKVAELHARNVDRALEWIERDPAGRFWLDGSWILGRFFDGRDLNAQERLLDELRAGRIVTNAFDALLLSGVADTEVLLRALGRAQRLAATERIPLLFANLTDVPSYSGALPTLLRQAGIGWFLGVANHARGANEDSDEIHVRSPWRWRGPDGSEALAFFADGYSQLRQLATDPVTTAGLTESLCRWLTRYNRADYVPADLPVVGLHTDNEDFADLPTEAVAAWNRRYLAPRLRWSTPPEYFAAVGTLAPQLPVLDGDGGSYWEDGVGSDPIFTARARRAVGELAAAESLAALLRSWFPALATPAGRFDAAWEDLGIAFEHTWTWAHVAVHPDAEQTRDQLRWKRDVLSRAERVARDEGERALSRLADLVATIGPAVVVYNPLPWPRPIVAEVEVAPETTFAAPPGNLDVAAAVLDEVDGLARTLLRVPDVPAFGYRIVRMEGGRCADRPSERSLDAGPLGAGGAGRGTTRLQVRTSRYVLGVDQASGRIQSLRHTASGLELIDATSPFSFAGLVVTAGGGTDGGRGFGEEATRLIEADPSLPWPSIAVRPASLRPSVHRRLPFGDVVSFTGEGEGIPELHVDLALSDDDDAIDVFVQAQLEPTRAKRAVYVAFPFGLAEPTVRFDRQVGWVDPARDQIPGSCHDWYTHFYAVVLEGPPAFGGPTGTPQPVGIFWASRDAPLFCLGDVVRGRWARAPLSSATVLSYVVNNHWNTNYRPTQGGRLELQYRFAPIPPGDLAQAARRGRELRRPGLVGGIGWLDKAVPRGGDLPETGASLLLGTVPEGLDLSCGNAEDGVLFRAQELAGREASFDFSTGPHAGRQKQRLGPFELRSWGDA